MFNNASLVQVHDKESHSSCPYIPFLIQSPMEKLLVSIFICPINCLNSSLLNYFITPKCNSLLSSSVFGHSFLRTHLFLTILYSFFKNPTIFPNLQSRMYKKVLLLKRFCLCNINYDISSWFYGTQYKFKPRRNFPDVYQGANKIRFFMTTYHNISTLFTPKKSDVFI